LVAAAWVVAHLVIPLRYYLGDDPHDERFAWRMFSAVRLQACSVDVEETVVRNGIRRRERLDLTRVLPATWTALLQRRRKAVSEELLDRRCAQAGIREVHLTHRCVDPSGRMQPPVVQTKGCGEGWS
jgi:hypothetical protein